MFRPLLPLDSKKLVAGSINAVLVIDVPHVTPGNGNVCATTRKLGPAGAIPAEQVTCHIDAGDVVAITASAVDGLQITTCNILPVGLAGRHAPGSPIRVDMPFLAVGANGNMGTTARKPVPATIPELE